MKSLLFTFLFLSLPVLTAGLLANKSKQQDVVQTVCYLVYNKIHLDEEYVRAWFNQCIKQSKQIKFFQSKNQTIKEMQNLLDRLGTHHLYLLTPIQEKFKSKGEAKATGVLSQLDGENLIIKKIIANSPAAKAGFLPGDKIIDVKGALIFHPNETFTKPGTYVVERTYSGKKKILKRYIGLAEIKQDLKIKVSKISNNRVKLNIPSFYSEILTRKKIQQLLNDIQPYKKVVIDLRDNEVGILFLA